MDDDGTQGFAAGEAALQNLTDNWEAIERKALRAVTAVIVPRLKEAAPIRVSTQQGGNSLPNGAFRTKCRGKIHLGKGGDDPSTATADFGDITWIANIVDKGHRAPHSRLLIRKGKPITGKPTPAHPFVRSVQDSTASAAQQAYEDAINQGSKDALNG